MLAFQLRPPWVLNAIGLVDHGETRELCLRMLGTSPQYDRSEAYLRDIAVGDVRDAVNSGEFPVCAQKCNLARNVTPLILD